MTKADIVDNLYEKLGLTKKDISLVVDTLFNTIREQIIAGNSVKLSGFGNFEVKTRGRRVGRNPQTGELKTIEPRTVVTFKPSQILKDAVNE